MWIGPIRIKSYPLLLTGLTKTKQYVLWVILLHNAVKLDYILLALAHNHRSFFLCTDSSSQLSAIKKFLHDGPAFILKASDKTEEKQHWDKRLIYLLLWIAPFISFSQNLWIWEGPENSFIFGKFYFSL